MYIIENANLLKDKQLKACSLLISNNRIDKIDTHFNYYRLIKMNAAPYIMTPTYVMLNSTIPQIKTFQELKKCLIEEFVLKGCTTMFTYVNVSYENELSSKISELKTALLSSPLDFLIGVRIPIRLITQSFIRKCKKEKVPAIFVDLQTHEELEQIPWGWIKDAMFPFNCPLIPIISSAEKKEVKSVLSKWKGTMNRENIPALYEEIEENTPLTISVMNKIGLYPQKASLMSGTEVSYNLYTKIIESRNVDDMNLFHYHSDRLVVTVHKGAVLRAGNDVIFKPGYGEHVRVRTPSFFSLTS
ncbi:hypothetical protein KW850_17850 [Bacillus sp. sid0103]|uniref:hypothetical protein n=1 Tax=Bacillus sp. sid0103 TaxID=2856337 RepID=UPI001C4955A2|nr:hypothetical protein [Bacillus sp. sid0103]MBV7507129.1 hypothetical protein [Bacillus sp. sid0103]